MSTEIGVLYGDLDRTRRVCSWFDRYEAYFLVFEVQWSVRESHMLRWQLHRCDKAVRVRSLDRCDDTDSRKSVSRAFEVQDRCR